MIRVLIVNEVRLLADIIASVLEDEDDIEVVGCSPSFEEALELIENNHIDVVLLSLKKKKQNALLLTKRIDQASPDADLVVYGLSGAEDHILPFIEAGADGIVKEKESAKDLIRTIRLVQQKKARFSPEVTRSLIDRISELSRLNAGPKTNTLPTKDLTNRELEVLACLGKNMTNKEIAEELVIEIGTVKNHVHHILKKLDVNTRGEASEYLLFTRNLSH
jgi:DNA-binding NarL/FixJ family response regulator